MAGSKHVDDLRFTSHEELANWLDSLYECYPDGAVGNKKWEAAQVAAQAVRGMSAQTEVGFVKHYPQPHPDMPPIIRAELSVKLPDGTLLYAHIARTQDTQSETRCDTCGDVIKPDLLTGTTCACAHTQKHDFYETGDKDAPAVILDRNGEVTLGLCRRCGQGEADLEATCPGVSLQNTQGEAFCFMPHGISKSVHTNLRLGNPATFQAYTEQKDPRDVPLYLHAERATVPAKTEMDYEYDEEGLLDTYCTGHMDGWNDCLKAIAAAPPQPEDAA